GKKGRASSFRLARGRSAQVIGTMRRFPKKHRQGVRLASDSRCVVEVHFPPTHDVKGKEARKARKNNGPGMSGIGNTFRLNGQVRFNSVVGVHSVNYADFKMHLFRSMWRGCIALVVAHTEVT